MSVFEIINTFSLYGVDVIALAFITTLTVQALKKTLLKNVQKKVFTFLPFIVGTVVYAIFACIVNLSLEYGIKNLTQICEYGFTVGALATFIYVLYEQLVRQKNSLSATENTVFALIEGYVSCEKVEQTAKAVAEALAKDVTETGEAKAAEILLESRSEGVSEDDIRLLVKLIIKSLAKINAP